MAALDFPDTPAVGDIYGTWRWDGFRWASTVGASGARGVVKNLTMPGGVINCPSNVTTTIVQAQSVDFVAGRMYRITYTSRAVAATPGGYINVHCRIDGTAHGAEQWSHQPGNYSNLHLAWVYIPPTTAARTVAISIAPSGITVGVYADVPPAFCIVEDITMEAGNTSGAGSPLKAHGQAKLSALAMSSTVNIPFASNQSSNPSIIAFNNAGGTITVGRAGNYLVGISFAVNVTGPAGGAYYHTLLYGHSGLLIGEDVSEAGQPYNTTAISGIWFGAQPGQLIQAQCYCTGGPGVTIRQGNLWVVEL
jgi:hypothetical protein